jgi:hypothetical protein
LKFSPDQYSSDELEERLARQERDGTSRGKGGAR